MKRKRSMYASVEVIVLAGVALLASTVLNTEYLFGWAAHNWKFYLILVMLVLLLVLLNKQFISLFMTTGIVVGIFAGNYIGKLIKGINAEKIVQGMKPEEVYRLRHNPGFEIWIGMILLFIIIGIMIEIIAAKKRIK